MGVSYTKLASIVAVAAVVGAVVFHSPVNAAPATFTWTGATGDSKMSTAGNWKEGAVPTAGSKLVFECVPKVNGHGVNGALRNDLTVAFSGLETKKLDSLPVGKECTHYIIDKMQFTPDAEFTGGHTSMNDKDGYKTPFVSIDIVTGLSNMKSNGFEGFLVNKKQKNYDHLELSRYEVANAGCNKLDYYVEAAEKIVGENASVLLQGANNILVKNKGQLGVYHKANETSASKITFENGATISHGLHCIATNVEVGPDVTTVLSGDIVLNGDVEFRLESNVTIKITGKLSGPGRLIAHRDNEGTILVESSNNTSGTPNGLYGNAHEPKLIKLDGEKPTEVLTVKKGETVLLNGSRSMNVYEGGVISGNITGGDFDVYGVVSPGNNSIGKITARAIALMDPGVYKVKILNKDHYDQIDAIEGVMLGYSRLDLTYLEGGVIKKGDTFTIIDNKGIHPVEGTFKDLPEGAEITAGGVTFKISYVGGDGNDIVLTALNDSPVPKTPKTPKAPNTGGEKLAVNLIGAVAGVASAAALLIVAKRKSFNKKIK